MKYRFEKVYEYAIAIDVEADSIEEAVKLANKGKWEAADGGEHYLVGKHMMHNIGGEEEGEEEYDEIPDINPKDYDF